MEKLIQYIRAGLLRLKTTSWKELVNQKSKDPIFWVRFSAYAIPLVFLLYVLYINYLPFGYSKTFIIDVGGPNDTKVSEFYLEPSPNLSERKVTEDGTAYRELNGSAFAVFKPNTILKDAEVTVSVDGKGISLIPPIINFDPSSVNWDYSWDFTKKIPEDLKGNAFIFDGATYFNGRDTRLELPNSTNMFEDDSFTVYAEWEPIDNENGTQQIIGHYNWELWQHKDNVEFRVGRMIDEEGPAYSIKYPITSNFFNTKHTAVAIYNPSQNGYIDLIVDGNFAGRTYFGKENIWKDYGNKNITFGKSNHGVANNFKGYLYKIGIISKNVLPSKSETYFKTDDSYNKFNISLVPSNTPRIKQIILNVTQR